MQGHVRARLCKAWRAHFHILEALARAKRPVALQELSGCAGAFQKHSAPPAGLPGRAWAMPNTCPEGATARRRKLAALAPEPAPRCAGPSAPCAAQHGPERRDCLVPGRMHRGQKRHGRHRRAGQRPDLFRIFGRRAGGRTGRDGAPGACAGHHAVRPAPGRRARGGVCQCAPPA